MKKIYLVITIILVSIVGFFGWWQFNKLAVNPLDKSEKIFVVSNHENIRDIAYNLKKDGLIRSPIVFFLTIKQMGLDGKIQAGDFRLSSSMTTPQIAQNLTHGTLDVWVTIPEGKRATEIAEILSQKISSYNASFAETLATQEGYLFPDTYLFPSSASISQIMTIMENNFNNKYAEAEKTKTTKLTKVQAVTLASIVEREAISPKDMQLAASVLENRLNAGMALGSDVTLEYALGYQPVEKTWWKKDLTVDDLNLDSPYNTRLNAGLPPTPISNPGVVALEAVLNPPSTDYLYYVSDNKGVLHFAKTLQEHDANVKKYMQ
jgi:UPF0755 protein